jgi:hypothetical protein
MVFDRGRARKGGANQGTVLASKRPMQPRDPIPCRNCGAMMTPEADGRTYACGFCHTRVQVAVDGAQIAAGMRLDLSNAEALLAHLANVLTQGWGEHTRVQAQGNYVHALEIDTEPDLFVLKREGHRLVAQRKKVVRGIALRTETLALDAWVPALCDALARLANANARAAWVLAQLRH